MRWLRIANLTKSVFVKPILCVRAAAVPAIRDIHNKASLVLPDGVSMTVGALLLCKRFPERLPGPNVMLEYCRYKLKKNRKDFFYGDTEEVAVRLVEKLKEKIPGLLVAGNYCPPFRSLTREEKTEVKKKIEESRADVLWVGLGAPKQEKWMA